MFAVLLLASVCVQFSSAAISAGACPKSPILADFNPALYAGTWYEIERFEFVSQQGLSCVRADYDFMNSTTVSVKNSGYNSWVATMSLSELARACFENGLIFQSDLLVWEHLRLRQGLERRRAKQVGSHFVHHNSKWHLSSTRKVRCLGHRLQHVLARLLMQRTSEQPQNRVLMVALQNKVFATRD